MARPSPVATAMGWLLVLMGGLWLLLTGGCTAVVLVTSIASMVKDAQTADWSAVLPFLFMAAICVTPGAVMLWLGLRMVKRRLDPTPPLTFD